LTTRNSKARKYLAHGPRPARLTDAASMRCPQWCAGEHVPNPDDAYSHELLVGAHDIPVAMEGRPDHVRVVVEQWDPGPTANGEARVWLAPESGVGHDLTARQARALAASLVAAATIVELAESDRTGPEVYPLAPAGLDGYPEAIRAIRRINDRLRRQQQP
jgi:hypothetical protein